MRKKLAYSIAVVLSFTVAVALFLGGIAPTIAQDDEGPRIVVTPNQALANQHISLVGVGFTPGSTIGEAPEGEAQVAGIFIDGEAIPWARINNGNAVQVESSGVYGGAWTTSVDLPLTAATTAAGSKTIQVTDSAGVTGYLKITTPDRKVTIEPYSSHIGTLATVYGEGFPARNERGSDIRVFIEYGVGGGNNSFGAARPDASGSFQTWMLIPLNATIESTNPVTTSFYDDAGAEVVNSATHHTLPPVITLNQTSGAPGSTVTIDVKGFRPSWEIRKVTIGDLDVIPVGMTDTDTYGMASFEITIPNLDTGTHTVEVQAERSERLVWFWTSDPAPTLTASADFTITGEPTPTPFLPSPSPTPSPSAGPPHVFVGTARLDGNIVPEGTLIKAFDGNRLVGAVKALTGGTFSIDTDYFSRTVTFTVDGSPASESWTEWSSGETIRDFDLTASSASRYEDTPALLFQANPELARVFAFDNVTKYWYFYDPTVADFSDLERFAKGHIYFFLVSHTTGLTMNGIERDLTCVAGNCWNQIVW